MNYYCKYAILIFALFVGSAFVTPSILHAAVYDGVYQLQDETLTV